MKCHNCGKPFKLKYSTIGIPHCALCGATVKNELGKLIGYNDGGIPMFSKEKKQPKKKAKKGKKK